MKKELNTRLMPISYFIKDLKLLNIDVTELEKLDLSCKVNCYDILDNQNYFVDNLYEILDSNNNVISYYTDKDYKIIKK